MGISLTGQAVAFGGAAALGLLVGLLYDLLRILRRRTDRRALGGVLDGLFWVLVTAALFLYAIRAGDGRLRPFMLAGAVLGAFFYFLTASASVRRAGERTADALARAGRRAVNIGKNFAKKGKKLFSFR